ncbi:MAG: SDR family oxidoreductase [Thiothrix sp.]|uniref:SDR family NAD(P)-dependent oxidoreductase n=1 Tax=Thiothrix sp. TaxID=1032 RepID=UPI0026157CC1|nr:SDR family oxidoreductase [Thiothrix sp.]MDD5395028.1 SDR family oxidoreductase [Thiothrix sp.]
MLTSLASSASPLPLGKLLSLRGRAAIVTEADGGMGTAIAQRLAEAGADMLLCGLNLCTLEKTCEDLQHCFGIDAQPLALDLSDPDAAYGLIRSATKHFLHTDILVNNAGIFPANPTRGRLDTAWDRAVNTNLHTAYEASRELAKCLQAQGKPGVILNILSIASVTSAGNPGDYLATKHILASVTKNMAEELGPLGIRCLALAPVRILKPAVALTPDVAAMMATNPHTRQAFEDYIAATLLGKTAQDDEVATIALFAVSEMARFISGAIIPVDGTDYLVH